MVRYFPSCDITLDDAELLVNTVNTVGVMGKGVALAFKERWPEIVPAYREVCAAGTLRPGGCLLLPLPDGRLWAALATKAHWRNPSQYPWIVSGLVALVRAAQTAGVRSVAIPPPGCGNGGLEWRRVEPLVLMACAGFDLRVYAATTVAGRAPVRVVLKRCPQNPLLEGQVVTIVSHDFVPTCLPSERNPLIDIETATGHRESVFLADVQKA